ncbi:MAG TPA: hypothetical protein VN719_14550, partial [Gemmatimonadales bacterium]|nr:hypothetical protein [Gemmatimonadales bacterium]
MSYTLWDSVGGHRGMVLAFFALLLLGGACTKNNLVQGRCNKSSDCANGLVCDNLETCVPATASWAPCSQDAQCGSGYSCDDLGWCVCGNKGATGGNVCANGSSVIYRGVETDGGMLDGAGGSAGSAGSGGAGGKGDGSTSTGGSGGFVCHAN